MILYVVVFRFSLKKIRLQLVITKGEVLPPNRMSEEIYLFQAPKGTYPGFLRF